MGLRSVNTKVSSSGTQRHAGLTRVSVACENPRLSWGPFFAEVDCTAVDEVSSPPYTALARTIRDLELALDPQSAWQGSPYSPMSPRQFFNCLPDPVVTCTLDSILGPLYAHAHGVVDGVCFVTFNLQDDWCFSYKAGFSCSQQAAGWFCGAMPESAFLHLMASRLGSRLDLRTPLTRASALPPLVAYEHDFDNDVTQVPGITSLKLGRRYFQSCETIDLASASSTLTTTSLIQALESPRRALLESLQPGGPWARHWEHILAWNWLSSLPEGPSRIPMVVEDYGLDMHQMDILLSLAPEWRDSAPALLNASRRL